MKRTVFIIIFSVLLFSAVSVQNEDDYNNHDRSPKRLMMGFDIFSFTRSLVSMDAGNSNNYLVFRSDIQYCSLSYKSRIIFIIF